MAAFATPAESQEPAQKGFQELGWQRRWGLPGLFLQLLEVYVRLEAKSYLPSMLVQFMLLRNKNGEDQGLNTKWWASMMAEEEQSSPSSGWTCQSIREESSQIGSYQVIFMSTSTLPTLT